MHAATEVSATAIGRDLVAADVAAVVARLGPTFATLLDRFQRPDAALEALVTAWQLQRDDHRVDVGQRRREEVHGDAITVITDALVPRLGRYHVRLDAALDRLDAGDLRYLAHPAVESYHSTWFELHEELIGLAGTDRAAETAAGRA